MLKKIISILILLSFPAIVFAAFRFNPYTGKPDFHDVTPNVPNNPTYPCTAGDIAIADGYIYACVAANTWQRAQLSTWEAVTKNVITDLGNTVITDSGNTVVH